MPAISPMKSNTKSSISIQFISVISIYADYAGACALLIIVAS